METFYRASVVHDRRRVDHDFRTHKEARAFLECLVKLLPAAVATLERHSCAAADPPALLSESPRMDDQPPTGDAAA
jgi:hypothetical protein